MLKEKILVVEDEEDVLELIRYNLELDGYLVDSAMSGKAALEKARSNKPDLILLDIMLPEIDGFEICKILKSDAATESIPICFLSARSENGDIINGLELGADDYITKPFSPHVLVSRVRTALRKRKKRLEEVSAHFRSVNRIQNMLPEISKAILEDIKKAPESAFTIDGGKLVGKNNGVAIRNDVYNLQLKADLRAAPLRDEFFLQYQPVFCVKAENIWGVEALVRWRHPTRGVMQPLEFIKIAEEAGLINHLGLWAFRRAAQDAKEWKMAGIAPPIVSVNFSALQFRHRNLINSMEETLSEAGLEAGDIGIEINGEGDISVLENSIGTLKLLNSRKMPLCFDNFGLENSSLDLVKNLSMRYIKLERSLVALLFEDANPQRAIESLVSEARSKGIKIVLKGIETLRQLQMARSLSVDALQGFVLSKPLFAYELGELLLKYPAIPKEEAL